ncbi:NUDIX hydrolase domain-like protein [Mucor mucedo]|uniref:NUDIX hydrolase domain-like protein n=1 Tax=Mucor mucedo TaxID=29922 RepID=UPI0022204943|nr:NUDIX hydrolase domain-like protein [Mucor mucedo]KAI7894062.1 NUDIX hydrolase domain-like protein [Mucor mucedo]
MSRQTLQYALTPVKCSSGTPMTEGNWIQLERLVYKDNKHVERSWERCVRKKPSPSAVDAVDIHAILLTPKPEILLVVQYRPAIERYCIEFPSGLVDKDDPIDAAQRELKEETGYTVPRDKILLTKTPLAYEPGLTNSCCYVAKVTIDTSELTAPPVQELEPDEWSLQTISLPLEGLMNHLLALKESQKNLLVIDSRVHALASGIAYANSYI